ncbi:MAG: hypothetical protein NW214_14135 [Pseudanabaenaceae cyanobacterium bins.39]|nr:hypothetical protein [Pseudanabaenaceae cyanobacterium bins.39]
MIPISNAPTFNTSVGSDQANSTNRHLSSATHNTPVASLANIWAKKYIQSLHPESSNRQIQSNDLGEILSSDRRAMTAVNLLKSLRFASSQAWAKTENLLIGQIQAHGINPELVDPWQIANDSQFLLEKALKVYTENRNSRTVEIDLSSEQQNCQISHPTQLPTTGQLSVAIASSVGDIRKKYTSVDPRAIGFVSMQFHYTGQILLNALPPLEQMVVNSYLKVIDDHLYMPLQRCYDAAASLDYHDITLESVRQLLPLTSKIAQQVSQKTLIMHSAYQCHSGLLSSPQVRISSLRDIEMFQVYLCLCVLEQSISSIQQELFPLCIMLYPPLQVSWELVRTLIRLLNNEMHIHLDPEYVQVFEPYLMVLSEMFSDDVLPEAQ